MEKYIKPNVEEIEVDEPQIFCDDSESGHIKPSKDKTLLGAFGELLEIENGDETDITFGFEEEQKENDEGFIGEEEAIDVVEEPIIEQEPIIEEEIIVEEPVVEDIPVEDIIE